MRRFCHRRNRIRKFYLLAVLVNSFQLSCRLKLYARGKRNSFHVIPYYAKSWQSIVIISRFPSLHDLNHSNYNLQPCKSSSLFQHFVVSLSPVAKLRFLCVHQQTGNITSMKVRIPIGYALWQQVLASPSPNRKYSLKN